MVRGSETPPTVLNGYFPVGLWREVSVLHAKPVVLVYGGYERLRIFIVVSTTETL